MDLFFNELSIKEGADKETGKQWMSGLIGVFKNAYIMGFKELKTTEEFRTFPLAPGYIIDDWLHDPQVDRETQLFVKTKASRPPFIDQVVEQKDNENNRLHEFKYNGQKAAGLGAAYLFETIALSFANSSAWDRHRVEIQVVEYTEEERIKSTVEEVKHASKPTHLDLLEAWINTRKRSDIPYGKLLWLKRKEYFPHLIFCKDVEKQIDFLTGNEPGFHLIKKRLFELEDFCSTWNTGIFTGENFPSKVTSESESRIAHFKDELTKVYPDGKEREFYWHLRYTPGHGRVHFSPDNSERRIYIGYIGSKIL